MAAGFLDARRNVCSVRRVWLVHARQRSPLAQLCHQASYLHICLSMQSSVWSDRYIGKSHYIEITETLTLTSEHHIRINKSAPHFAVFDGTISVVCVYLGCVYLECVYLGCVYLECVYLGCGPLAHSTVNKDRATSFEMTKLQF